ncbi:MAG: EamA family transporter RarD [Deltaproteobacteria bacterium]|nr:EamA family transporter RarD [Deltaproteobacteria bacterium]
MSREKNIGVLFALAAYGFWGFVPFYFKAVGHVPAMEILTHRIIWSVPMTAILIAFAKDWPKLKEALSSPGVLRTLFITALLVATNWLVFIYAVNTGRVLQASLGYYICPLVNVLLGVIFLRERLRRLQVLSVLFAAAGTAIITIHYGRIPWIALYLGITFSTYGLLRKTIRIESVNGLFMETSMMFPFAAGYLVYLGINGSISFGTIDSKTTLLLILAGAVTTFPLVWFTSAARRLQYTTMGLIQYIAPSLMFLLAVFRYQEPFTMINFMSFGCIWAGLAIYVFDTILLRRFHHI